MLECHRQYTLGRPCFPGWCGVSSDREQEGSQVCNGVERQSRMLAKGLAIIRNRSRLAYVNALDTGICEYSCGRSRAFNGFSRCSKRVKKE